MTRGSAGANLNKQTVACRLQTVGQPASGTLPCCCHALAVAISRDRLTPLDNIVIAPKLAELSDLAGRSGAPPDRRTPQVAAVGNKTVTKLHEAASALTDGYQLSILNVCAKPAHTFTKRWMVKGKPSCLTVLTNMKRQNTWHLSQTFGSHMAEYPSSRVCH